MRCKSWDFLFYNDPETAGMCLVCALLPQKLPCRVPYRVPYVSGSGEWVVLLGF
jgi:hypothetical protein